VSPEGATEYFFATIRMDSAARKRANIHFLSRIPGLTPGATFFRPLRGLIEIGFRVEWCLEFELAREILLVLLLLKSQAINSNASDILDFNREFRTQKFY
jgi:hypothetical protein